MSNTDDFLAAYFSGMTADLTLDQNQGSIFEVIGGAAAILWSRENDNDISAFQATATATATGDALSTRLNALTGVSRIQAQPGTGMAQLVRAGTTAGTIWQGTLIGLRGNTTESSFFQVAQDVTITTGTTSVQIPILATGINVETNISVGSDVTGYFFDTTFDSSLQIVSLQCSAGTPIETAAAYRARAKTTKFNARNGAESSVLAACKAAGAGQAVLFPSNTGPDYGLNMVYVGDSSFNSTPALIRAVTFALDDVRCLGDCIQVCAMQSVALQISMIVYLKVAPSTVDQTGLLQRIRNYVVASLNSNYGYSLDQFAGAAYRASPLVQNVIFNLPVADMPFLVDSYGTQNFPPVLNRYNLQPQNIAIYFRAT